MITSLSASFGIALMIAGEVAPPPPPPAETVEAEAPVAPPAPPATTEAETTGTSAPPPESPTDDAAAGSDGAVNYAAEVEAPDPITYSEEKTTEDPVDFATPNEDQLPAPVDYSSKEAKAPMLEAADISLAPPAPFKGSPQRFAIELKFGPYLPSVDGDYPGPGLGAYAEIFGETNDRGVAVEQPRDRLMSQLGFEWQFLNVGGPLSLGTSIGFFQDRAQALLVQTSATDESVRSKADRVRFSVLPVTLLLGYRFELLADRFRVPLVPYVRGGLAYGFWWASNGNGDIAVNDAGVKGRGGSAGWQVNLGMMLRLDFLERSAAKALDTATGINHTYIVGEWQFSRMDGFGTLLNKVSVGDDTWYLGLAIEI